MLLIVVLAVVFSGDKEKIVSVQTEKVAKRTYYAIVSANGTINPVEKVELRPEVTGEIVELPVKEGDKVKKGQLLIRLKPEQYIARRNRAEASLKFAEATLRGREASLAEVEANYNRVKELYAKELSSESDFRTSKIIIYREPNHKLKLKRQMYFKQEKVITMQSRISKNSNLFTTRWNNKSVEC